MIYKEIRVWGVGRTVAGGAHDQLGRAVPERRYLPPHLPTTAC